MLNCIRCAHDPRRNALTSSLSLDVADAMEHAELLDLLRGWLTADHGQLTGSLERFIGSTAYGVETLCSDLANFAFLLGGNDGEHFTAPGPDSP